MNIININDNLLQGKVLMAVSTTCWRTRRSLSMEIWQRETITAMMTSINPNVSRSDIEAVIAAEKLATALSKILPDDQAKAIVSEFEEEKKRTKLGSLLLDCDEYDNIVKHVSRGKEAVLRLAVPFPIINKRGLYLCSKDSVEEIAKVPEQFNRELRERLDLIPLLVANYERRKEEAKRWLRNQYAALERYYPKADELPNLFRIETQFVDIRPADDLPPEMRKAEFEKFQRRVAAAAEEVVIDLRATASDIVSKMIGRLTAKEQDGKAPRLFGSTLLENLNDFIATFSSKNVFNDAALNEVILKAKEITRGLTVDELKNSDGLRRQTARRMEEVGKAIDVLVEEATRTRRFTLDEE